jgi:hypothetical protein
MRIGGGVVDAAAHNSGGNDEAPQHVGKVAHLALFSPHSARKNE